MSSFIVLPFARFASSEFAQSSLPLPSGVNFGDVISGDTKHILAWVKENNPKQYVADRYDKARQPSGDPDCKLGCKKRRNKGDANGDPAPPTAGAPVPSAITSGAPATPTAHPTPASHATVGEFHWGYASGIIATKVPGWGEFVLAEGTRTFDKSDPSYFFPLMQQVEQRLGHRPRYGAFDAAYDAFYVHQYFHEAGGFAAVPLVAKGRQDVRAFSSEGLPLCAAGLPMPLKFTFTDRTTTLVVHERGKYVCPLRHPQTTPEGACPINHERWPKGGCTVMTPTCAGARLRYQLDRNSQEYKTLYNQRTADERINSQGPGPRHRATAPASPECHRQPEYPDLRADTCTCTNRRCSAGVNLRALQRIHQRKEELTRQAKMPPAHRT